MFEPGDSCLSDSVDISLLFIKGLSRNDNIWWSERRNHRRAHYETDMLIVCVCGKYMRTNENNNLITLNDNNLFF